MPQFLVDYISTSTRYFESDRLSGHYKELIFSGKTVDAKWIFLAIKSTDESGSKGLVETIDGINKLIAIGDFRHIDRVLQAVDAGTASRQILLGLARSTYPVRSKLNHWKLFIFDVHKSFLDRKLDAARLLQGLIEK